MYVTLLLKSCVSIYSYIKYINVYLWEDLTYPQGRYAQLVPIISTTFNFLSHKPDSFEVCLCLTL